MAKNNHIANSFVTGEVSKKFLGRTDAQQYNNSCEELLNSLVYPQGGSGRRPGTKFVREVKNVDGTTPKQVRIIPFHASDGTRWQLVLTSNPPEEGTGTGEDELVEYNWYAINVKSQEVEYIVPAFTEYTVISIPPPPDPEVTEPGAYSGYYDFEVDEVDMNTLQYAQSDDVLFCVDGFHRPFKIVYDADSANVFSLRPFPDSIFATANPNYPTQELGTFKQMPFLEPVIQTSDPESVLTLIVTGGGDITVNAIGGFTTDWIGKYIKFTRDTPGAAVILITHYNSATELRGVLVGGTAPGAGTQDYGGSDADFYYEEGAWDDIKGWPRTVCFFEGRLIFGGTKTFPDTIWFSSVNNIDIFDYRGLITDSDYADPETTADAFETTLRGNLLNEIRWLSDSKTITVGTNYREYVVQGPSSAKTLGVDNIQSNAETPHGSAQIQATRIENTTVFLQRHRRAIRELVYNLDENSFQATNLNIIGEHIAKKGAEQREDDALWRQKGYFVAMAMQEVPLGILWCLDNNGMLCGMTRERQQQVNAWHYHELGGTSFKLVDGVPISYKPFIQSISTIQKPAQGTYDDGPEGEPDELWAAVSRGYKADADTPYNEVPRTYIERFMDEWENPKIESGWVVESEPQNAPVYMDCAVITSSEQADQPGVITGLPHSHGEEVSVVCNGIDFGEYTVDEGSIDISQKLTDLGITDWQAIVGFNYLANIIPVTPEVQAQLGSSQGQSRRIDRITIHFLRTIGCKFGLAEDPNQDDTPSEAMEEVEFRRESLAQNAPTPMFTGDKQLNFPQGYDTRPKVHIQSHRPLPMQVTHIVYRMVVYEG